MSKEKGTFSYDFQGIGLTTPEKNRARQRFEDYIEIYPHLYKLSDLQLLEELVFMEAIQERYKKKIGKLSKRKLKPEENKLVDDADAVPKYLQEQLNTNLEQILRLKEKLGMFEQKKKLDAYRDIQSIFGKFANWRKKNQGSRKVTCPFCSKLFFLMIRTDKYDVKKFPFFQDKVLCNPELHRTWKEGCITKERYAKILGTSPDYIDWLETHHFTPLAK